MLSLLRTCIFGKGGVHPEGGKVKSGGGWRVGRACRGRFCSKGNLFDVGGSETKKMVGCFVFIRDSVIKRRGGKEIVDPFK